ncbi:MAG: hypothetical protein OQJ74_00205, partial [Ignavibacteriaceae bacterium]|nr:hypothetical protein [Ignavibacteriaceae bacterium]
KTASTAKRDVVEIQLMKNLYTVAAMYVGNEDKCMDFFDQSFIRNGSNGGDDEEPTPPTP